MEELKLYMVEFHSDCTIKPKIYPSNCVMGGENRQLIIVITYNEYAFFANNRIQKTWS